jgi:hypothetical protein
LSTVVRLLYLWRKRHSDPVSDSNAVARPRLETGRPGRKTFTFKLAVFLRYEASLPSENQRRVQDMRCYRMFLMTRGAGRKFYGAKSSIIATTIAMAFSGEAAVAIRVTPFSVLNQPKISYPRFCYSRITTRPCLTRNSSISAPFRAIARRQSIILKTLLMHVSIICQ